VGAAAGVLGGGRRRACSAAGVLSSATSSPSRALVKGGNNAKPRYAGGEGAKTARDDDLRVFLVVEIEIRDFLLH